MGFFGDPTLLSAGLSAAGIGLIQVSQLAPIAGRLPILTKLVQNGARPIGNAEKALSATPNKAAVIAMNVTPGPDDVVRIIEGPRTARPSSSHRSRSPVGRGFVSLLDEATHERRRTPAASTGTLSGRELSASRARRGPLLRS